MNAENILHTYSTERLVELLNQFGRNGPMSEIQKTHKARVEKELQSRQSLQVISNES